MTRRALAVGALAVATAAGGARAAAAADGQVQLPQPIVGLSGTPPLTSSSRPVLELRIPGPLSSTERIRADVDTHGRPVAVTATQRLLLAGPGDYTFAIPAPVEDVLPGPGTESMPGFRRGAILWQGFSPGHRVLSARAKLELRPAVAALPLGLTLSARAGGAELDAAKRRSGDVEVTLDVDNRTAITTQSFVARGDVDELAEILDGAVRALRRHVPLPAGIVTVHGGTPRLNYRVDVEFRIEGRLLFPVGALEVTSVAGGRVERVGRATSVRFEGSIGGDRPKRLRVRIHGRGTELGPPRLSLEAMPVLMVGGLLPPRGETWAAAVRRGLVEVDGRSLMETAVRAFLRLARTNQYSSYLLNPDVSAGLVRDTAAYLYASAPVQAATASSGEGDSGLGALGLAAILVAVVVAAAGGLVLWAHS